MTEQYCYMTEQYCYMTEQQCYMTEDYCYMTEQQCYMTEEYCYMTEEYCYMTEEYCYMTVQYCYMTEEYSYCTSICEWSQVWKPASIHVYTALNSIQCSMRDHYVLRNDQNIDKQSDVIICITIEIKCTTIFFSVKIELYSIRVAIK